MWWGGKKIKDNLSSALSAYQKDNTQAFDQELGWGMKALHSMTTIRFP